MAAVSATTDAIATRPTITFFPDFGLCGGGGGGAPGTGPGPTGPRGGLGSGIAWEYAWPGWLGFGGPY
ncbi:hypothetical protein MTP03_16010 [Tsukamurella sp. PLM1]|nr:hypothetical protein MTP03_16010 [Tsukamurella sp. PLM1]